MNEITLQNEYKLPYNGSSALYLTYYVVRTIIYVVILLSFNKQWLVKMQFSFGTGHAVQLSKRNVKFLILTLVLGWWPSQTNAYLTVYIHRYLPG